MPIPLVVGAILGGVLKAAEGALMYEAIRRVVVQLAESSESAWRPVLSAAEEWGAGLIARSMGVALDPDRPFSDASLCNAITQKTGMALRTLRDGQSIRDDAEFFALAQLEANTGLKLRKPRDAVAVRADVMRWVTPLVSDRSGILLTDLSDTARTRAELTDHVKDAALIYLADDIGKAKAAVQAVGVDLEAIVKEVQRKGGVDPRTGLPMVNIGVDMIVLGILSRALIAADSRRKLAVQSCDKGYARKIARRASLAAFREKNGHRLVYQPV